MYNTSVLSNNTFWTSVKLADKMKAFQLSKPNELVQIVSWILLKCWKAFTFSAQFEQFCELCLTVKRVLLGSYTLELKTNVKTGSSFLKHLSYHLKKSRGVRGVFREPPQNLRHSLRLINSINSIQLGSYYV